MAGNWDGVRILLSLTVELMHTNVLAGRPYRFSRRAQGFGLDFAVYTDPVAAGGYFGKGSFFWGGAAGALGFGLIRSTI